MKSVVERKKKGPAFYLIRLPLIILLVFVNGILISWFFYLLYMIFTDSPDPMSLLEWAKHLYIVFIRSVKDL